MGLGLDEVGDYTGDFVPVVAATGLMVGLFQLPRTEKLELALHYQAPTPLATFASHFVHLTSTHLVANLAAFGLLFSLTYALALVGHRRRLFNVAALTYVLAFPPVLSWLNLALARPRIGFGFSGVAMAFLGLLPLVMGAAIQRRFPHTEALTRAPGFFLAGLAVMAWLAVPTPGPRVAITAITLLAALSHLPGWPSAESLLGGVRWLAVAPQGAVVLAGLVVFLAIPLAAFPADPASGNTVLNLYTHLLGYCLGFIAPYATIHVVDRWGGPATAAAIEPRSVGAGAGSRVEDEP